MKLRALAAGLLRLVPSATAGWARSSPGPYEFTQDFFSHKIPHWEKLLEPLKGRSGLRYLEVGVFEGRSLLWMLDNVLTSETARAIAIDIFTLDYRQRLERNLKASGVAEKVQVLAGPGEVLMKGLEESSFDIVYLDGGHAGWTVYQQTALAWMLLRDGGLLVFDDYRWHQDDFPAELRPQPAIDAFLTCFEQQLELVHAGVDVFIRKKARACHDYYCSPVTEKFVYLWRERQLLAKADRREVALTPQQRTAMESLLLGSPTAGLEGLLLDPAFRELVGRLQEEP
jgi:predicted O-methyltransferase YrrM